MCEFHVLVFNEIIDSDEFFRFIGEDVTHDNILGLATDIDFILFLIEVIIHARFIEVSIDVFLNV